MQNPVSHRAVRTAFAVAAMALIASMATEAAASVKTEAIVQGNFGNGYYANDSYLNGADSPTVLQGSVEAILPSTPDGAPYLSSQSGVRTTNGNGSYATAHADLVSGIGGITGVTAPVFLGNLYWQYNETFANFDLQDTFTARFSGGGTRTLQLTAHIDGDYAKVNGGGSAPITSMVGIAAFGQGSFQYEIVGTDRDPLANPLSAFLTPGQTWGWLSQSTDFSNPLDITLSGTIAVSDGQLLPFRSYMALDCRVGAQCNFGNTITASILLPDGVTLTSAATGNAVAFAHYATPPVPEPQTYLLMLAGLAAVGWTRRRHTRRN